MDSSTIARLARHRLSEVAGGTFDLVVIGGGITGAGIARHASACGLRTLLLEANDFAAGTSSRSTKLIHGGLRYLAMGDFALVREGALERKSLLAMAPHLVEPRWMLVPARSRMQYAKLRLGITLYEWLGAVSGLERHRNWNAEDLSAGEPLLERERLPWACVYREYLTDDARLVIATLRAAAALGAETCNYSPVVSIRQVQQECLVSAVDRRTGEACEVRAGCVVNAAGPWVEELLTGDPSSPPSRPHVYLSRGVHLVISHERLPVRHMVMMTAADGRPVFAIGRGAVTYVGTTDTTHSGAAEHWPKVTAADIDYLIATVNRHFRMPPVTQRDVLATWAGLRPLIHQPGKAPKEMSRRDEIWRDGALVTIAGGKLTGFRRMAEQAMKIVGAVLHRDVGMPQPLAPLPGGDIGDVADLIEQMSRHYQLDHPVAARLVRLYGSEAPRVLGERPTPLSPSMFLEEVDWAADVEGARSLEDVVYRRMRAAWFHPNEVDALLAGAVGRLSDRLGWNVDETAGQASLVRRRLAEELAFRHPAVSGVSR